MPDRVRCGERSSWVRQIGSLTITVGFVVVIGASVSSSEKFRVEFVCSGNTCRSPMAAHLLGAALDEAGLGETVSVGSSGTVAEPGAGMDPRAAEVLGITGERGSHAARRTDPGELAAADLIVCMGARHLAQVEQGLPTRRRATVVLMSGFDPAAADGADIADPFRGDLGRYQETRSALAAALPGLLARIRAGLAAGR